MKTGVLGGLFKDWPKVMAKKIGGWGDAFIFGFVPTVGVYQYAVNYKENEKQHHRY